MQATIHIVLELMGILKIDVGMVWTSIKWGEVGLEVEMQSCRNTRRMMYICGVDGGARSAEVYNLTRSHRGECLSIRIVRAAGCRRERWI